MFRMLKMRILHCTIWGFAVCAHVQAAAWELTSRQGQRMILRIEYRDRHHSIQILDRESNRTILATDRAYFGSDKWSWGAGRFDTGNGCTMSVSYTL